MINFPLAAYVPNEVDLQPWIIKRAGLLEILFFLQALYAQIYILGSFFVQKGETVFISIKKGVIFFFNSLPALLLMALVSVIVAPIVADGMNMAAELPRMLTSWVSPTVSQEIVTSFPVQIILYALRWLLNSFFILFMMSFFVAPVHLLFVRSKQ